MNVGRTKRIVWAVAQREVTAQRAACSGRNLSQHLEVSSLPQSDRELFLQRLGLLVHDDDDLGSRPARCQHALRKRLSHPPTAEILRLHVDEVVGGGDGIFEKVLDLADGVAVRLGVGPAERNRRPARR
jgi:hypothetical protein